MFLELKVLLASRAVEEGLLRLLFNRLSVDHERAIDILNLIAGQPNDPLTVVLAGFQGKAKYHNIA